jgi:hypothetical protein
MTETLVEAGVEVVGRTRFCIHPAQKVKSIPAVGGTKNIDWEKVKALNADILLLDKEENPKFFAEESPIPFLAIHVTDIHSCIQSLLQMSVSLHAPILADYAHRWEVLKSQEVPLDRFVDWVRPPEQGFQGKPAIEYIIWKDPIMAVSRNTFIGSLLELLGYSLPLHETRYPRLPDELDAGKIYLFSSEPYPFASHKDWIVSNNIASGLVDGESFSWFGIRSLRFLEKMLGQPSPGEE